MPARFVVALGPLAWPLTITILIYVVKPNLAWTSYVVDVDELLVGYRLYLRKRMKVLAAGFCFVDNHSHS